MGLLLGLAGPLAEKCGNPDCVTLNAVFSSGWSWACYAFLVGYLRRSKIESALLSSLGLAVGVVAYYLFKYLSPTIPAGLESGAVSEGISSGMFVWGIAAFILGAPLGLFGNLARIPGVGGLPFRLVVPFVTFFETSMRLATEADRQRVVVEITWTVIRFIAAAVALALVGHTIRSWWHARRTHSSGSDEHRAGEISSV
ncbi:hypothetical protein [Streptomyces sp. NPDC058683]|uniref:hypothetical protein n=1 Tax=Streptomyces sp. NPDC058683 TaxID=3346597 RepID=UPI003668E088